MEKMIAYCGLDCDTCPIHLITLEQDELKKQVMKSAIVQTCAQQYGMNIRIQDLTGCDGCRVNKQLFSGCNNCEIRKCAMEKKIESCAFCNEFCCEILSNHFKIEPSAQKRLEKLRANQ